jgi:hypothetical protein
MIMGDDFAVTVDDIIVFNTQPAPFSTNPQSQNWWGHEVTHVEQYQRWGVEEFAYRYAKDAGAALEGEAKARGAAVVMKISNARQNVPNPDPTFFAQNSEQYVARCYFTQDHSRFFHLVTDRGRIFDVDPISGASTQAGWAQPAQPPAAGWTYEIEGASYPVLPDGKIMMKNSAGQLVQVGEVLRLN